jgi:hypothetical protein
MIVALITLLSPFIQLGPSYYASVATLILLLAIVQWWRPLGIGVARAGLLLLVVLFMPLALTAGPSIDPLNDRLRIAREGVMLVLLLAGMMGFGGSERRLAHAPLWLIVGLAGIYLVVAWMQTNAYNEGRYLGLPAEWFAQESGTIATDLALIYGPDSLRPAASFSEPSYFGFVLLSIALMLVPLAGKSRLATTGLVLAIAAGLLSRSLSFFLAVIVVIVLPFALERQRHRGALILALIAVTVPLVAFSGSALLSRLGSATSAETADASTADRIFGPLLAMPGYLAEYPAGSPFSSLEQTLVPHLADRTNSAGEILNNALFNLIFAYGVVGFAIIAAILVAARDLRMRLYMVVCAMFNGAFLAIDKVAMITLTLATYEYCRRLAAEAEATRVAAAAEPVIA